MHTVWVGPIGHTALVLYYIVLNEHCIVIGAASAKL